MRTGVSVQAVKRDDLGCVEFMAFMDSDYKPMPLTRLDYQWAWSDINYEAGLAAHSPMNVQQLVRQAGQEATGFPLIDAPIGVNISNNIAKTPVIDRYAPLKPIGGAADQQPGFVTSDAQPFPFYGWAKVFWRTPNRVLYYHGQESFFVVPDHLDLNNGAPTQYVTVEWTLVKGVPPTPPTINTVKIVGADAALFRITQDNCSGQSVSLNVGCRIFITSNKPNRVGGLTATLVIADTKGGVVDVPLSAPGLIQ